MKPQRISLLSALLLFAIAFAFSFTIQKAAADCGFIGPRDWYASEPFQGAIIAFSGNEESLLLGMDVNVGESAQVLRFLPLPSEPRISEGDSLAFLMMQAHIAGAEDYAQLREYSYSPEAFDVLGSVIVTARRTDPLIPKIEVLSQARIKAHSLTVLKVNDPSDFRAWVARNLPKEGFSDSYQRMDSIVQHYVREDVRYFVLDQIALSPGGNKPVPLLYRFPTSKVFYPLVTSNFMGSALTEVNLVLLTPQPLALPDSLPLGPARYSYVSSILSWAFPSDLKALARRGWPLEFPLGVWNLQMICPDFRPWFPKGAFATVLRAEQKGSNFTADLWFTPRYREVAPPPATDTLLALNPGLASWELWKGDRLLGTFSEIQCFRDRRCLAKIGDIVFIYTGSRMGFLLQGYHQMYRKSGDGSFTEPVPSLVPRYQVPFARFLLPRWLYVPWDTTALFYDLDSGAVRAVSTPKGPVYFSNSKAFDLIFDYGSEYDTDHPTIFDSETLTRLYQVKGKVLTEDSRRGLLIKNLDGTLCFVDPRKRFSTTEVSLSGKLSEVAVAKGLGRMVGFKQDILVFFDLDRDREIAKMKVGSGLSWPWWLSGDFNPPADSLEYFNLEEQRFPYNYKSSKMVLYPSLNGRSLAFGPQQYYEQGGGVRLDLDTIYVPPDSVYYNGTDTTLFLSLASGTPQQKYRGFLRRLPNGFLVSTRDTTYLFDPRDFSLIGTLNGMFFLSSSDHRYWLLRDGRNTELYDAANRTRITTLSSDLGRRVFEGVLKARFEVCPELGYLLLFVPDSVPGAGKRETVSILDTSGTFLGEQVSDQPFEAHLSRWDSHKYLLGASGGDSYLYDLKALKFISKIPGLYSDWVSGWQNNYFGWMKDSLSYLLDVSILEAKLTDFRKMPFHQIEDVWLLPSDTSLAIYSPFYSSSFGPEPSRIKFTSKGYQVRLDSSFTKLERGFCSFSTRDSVLYLDIYRGKEVCRFPRNELPLVKLPYDWESTLAFNDNDTLLFYSARKPNVPIRIFVHGGFKTVGPYLFALQGTSFVVFDTLLTPLTKVPVHNGAAIKSVQSLGEVYRPRIERWLPESYLVDLGNEVLLLDAATLQVAYRVALHDEALLEVPDIFGGSEFLSFITGNSQRKTIHFVSPQYPFKQVTVSSEAIPKIEFLLLEGKYKITFLGKTEKIPLY